MAKAFHCQDAIEQVVANYLDGLLATEREGFVAELAEAIRATGRLICAVRPR